MNADDETREEMAARLERERLARQQDYEQAVARIQGGRKWFERPWERVVWSGTPAAEAAAQAMQQAAAAPQPFDEAAFQQRHYEQFGAWPSLATQQAAREAWDRDRERQR